MAAEALSFEKKEGDNLSYYASFVSDGNPVTIQIKNKGGRISTFANIEGMTPMILFPDIRGENGAPDAIFRFVGIASGITVTIKSASEVESAKMIREEQ